MLAIRTALILVWIQTMPLCIYGLEPGCKPPKLINMKNADQQDLESLDSAIVACPVRYDDAPCLKSFKKVEQGIYEAICGQPPK